VIRCVNQKFKQLVSKGKCILFVLGCFGAQENSIELCKLSANGEEHEFKKEEFFVH